MAYIELDRQFVAVRTTGDLEVDAPDYSSIWSAKVPWTTVLEHPRVVILGEACTGKTTEFRERTRLLASAGTPAFGLTVEDLAQSGIPRALDPDDEDRFDRWYNSTDRGLFFVDSVDEARLNAINFRTALVELKRGLRDQLARATILVSCRVSDWRPASDEATIRDTLRPPGTDVPEVQVFSIAPLDLERVEKFAAHLGLSDPRGFRREAEAAGAQAFLERPGDVAWMATYWQKHGRFGRLTELMEENIGEKLAERNEDLIARVRLDGVRALRAIEALAGCAWLERVSSFVASGGASSVVASALRPELVLRDLDASLVKELLTRPIFDEATYGRVRIHHRSIAEYLVARWFWSLHDHGLPRPDLESLLFRDGPDRVVVPNRWKPVAAWIASFDPVIRHRLLNVSPSAFLIGGDPESLTPADRRDILDGIAASYVGRERRFEDADSATLRRFAMHSDPADVARHLQTTNSDELLGTLLTIASEGKMSSCVNDALRIATAGRGRSRHQAISCVVAVGTSADADQMLARLIDQASTIDHDVGGTLVHECYPLTMSVDRLLTLLDRVDAPPPNTGTLLPFLLGQSVLPKTAPSDRLRIAAAVLMRENASDSHWLFDSLAGMTIYLGDQLTGNDLAQLEPHFQVLSAAAHSLRSHSDGLRDLLRRKASLRRLVFWWDTHRARTETAEKVTRFTDLVSGEHLWELTEHDAAWLLDDARTMADVADRLLAFDCLHFQPLADHAAEDREHILDGLAAGEDVLRERRDEIRRMRMRTPQDEARDAQRRETRREREETHRQAQEKDRELVTAALEGIRDGTNATMIAWLFWHAEGATTAERMTQRRLQFGAAAASAMESGLRRMWRLLPCPLAHESNSRTSWQMTARAGLDLDIDLGLDLTSLDMATAHLAARHAADSIDRFPRWTDVLLEAQPVATRQVFEECIRAEYTMPTGTNPFYGFVHHLTHASDAIKQACRPILFAVIAASDAPRNAALAAALQALVAADASMADLASLAPARYAVVSHDREAAAAWWGAWLAADPDAATQALADETGALMAPADQDALVLDAFERLLRFAQNLPRYPYPTSAAALGRLAELGYARVRLEDDRHGSGARNERDHAETTRNHWLELLFNTPGRASYDELRRLAEVAALVPMRDYILAKADQRVSEDLAATDPPVAARILATYRRHGLAALNRTGSMSAALAALGQLDRALNPVELHDLLSKRSGWEIDQLILFADLDSSLFPPPSAPVGERAVQLASYARQVPDARRRLQDALAHLAEM